MKKTLLPVICAAAVVILFASCASAPKAASGAGSSTSMGAVAPEKPAAEPTTPAAPASRDSAADTAKSPADTKPVESTAAPKTEAAAGFSSAEADKGGGVRGASKDIGGPGDDLDWAADAPSGTGRGESSAPAARAPAGASGLQAAFADDNKQFNYFINFLDEYADQVPHFSIPVGERIIVKVADQSGKPVPNARVSIAGSGKVLAEGVTYADGTFLFFPSEHESLASFTASVSALGMKKDVSFDRLGKRTVEIQLQGGKPEYKAVPLDILFIMDTTGSMAEEIERLKATIEIINMNLSALSSKPKVRFGMVLYRDRGDEYVTDVVPLTGDLSQFQRELSRVEADGGGDDPEDLQAALKDAITGIAWNPDGIRMAFTVTDAPPHLDYSNEPYTYVDAVHDARARGIKLFSVGTGGLDLAGEIVLRQISQYTNAKYIFLTYGEKGESTGGAAGSVSHHTGSNFVSDKLEAIIIRFAKEELAWLTDQPLTDEGDFFQAVETTGEEKEKTMATLFDMAISQIIDYASIGIPAGTPTGALPIVPQAGAPAADAEYFSEQLVLSLARSKTFSAVARKDLQAVLKELELQMSGITDEANAARLGKMIGAQMLLSSTMFDKGGDYEIFLKLLRVETGEILSVTKLVVDKKLGLSK